MLRRGGISDNALLFNMPLGLRRLDAGAVRFARSQHLLTRLRSCRPVALSIARGMMKKWPRDFQDKLETAQINCVHFECNDCPFPLLHHKSNVRAQ